MVLKFIALGDMGSGEKEQYDVSKGIQTIIKNFQKQHLKNISFIVGLGDNIYECGVRSVDDPQFKEKFEKPYKKIDKKFYMCLGNHDYSYPDYCGPAYSDSPQHQIEYSKISKKWILPNKYYYYTYSAGKKCDVDFFVMDTNIDRMSKEECTGQMKFLVEAINNSKAKWKILYGHHPWRSLGGHGHAWKENKDLEDYFKELIRKTSGKGQSTIDLYMCGHDHNKQYIEIGLSLNKKKFKIPLVVCGTGGKIEKYDAPAITNSEKNDYIIEFFATTLGFLCVKIDNNILELFFFDASGKNIEFRKTLKK